MFKKFWKWIVGGSGALIVTFVVLVVIIIGAMSQAAGSGGDDGDDYGDVTNIGLSKEVLAYKDLVEKECKEQGVPELVPYVLAIMMNETRGIGNDVMQCSESQGLAPNSLSPSESIHYGVAYLKSNKNLADQYGIDIFGAIMGYNFGSNYINWMAKNGYKKSTTPIADQYSKNVVAPASGNTSGATYVYKNEISVPYNGGFLYTNGGNFFYDKLVKRYLQFGGGSKHKRTRKKHSGSKVIDEAQKYLGVPYVWGGHDPATGMDCSGFVGYVLTKVTGKQYPQFTVSLESCGTPVPLSQLSAGDMIFYGSKGSSYHVAFYMGDGQVIEEPKPGDVCHIRPLSAWQPDFAVRPNL